MRSTQAFAYTSRPFDHAAVALGAGERLLRALLRRWSRGEGFRFGELRGTQPAAPAGPPPPTPGAPVVVLPALPWGFRFQRPQQLFRALAAEGHPVLYVEGFRRTRWQPRHRLLAAAPGVWRLEVSVAGRPDLFRAEIEPAEAARLATLLLAGLRRPPAAVVVQLPGWRHLAAELRRRLACPLIYDRIDLHACFAGVPAGVADREEELVAACDLVTATSTRLLALSTRDGNHAHLLRNAVALEDFPLAPQPPPDPVRVGYVGALAEWFDAEALRRAATARPDWRFDLAGRVENEAVAALGRLPNVRLRGEIPYPDVAAFLARQHVGLIPFVDDDLTRAVDPIKLYEGFAVGLPMVARELPELARWVRPDLTTYRRAEELAPAIECALAGDGDAGRRRRRRLVEDETWSRRAVSLLDLVAAAGEPVAPPAARRQAAAR